MEEGVGPLGEVQHISVHSKQIWPLESWGPLFGQGSIVEGEPDCGHNGICKVKLGSTTWTFGRLRHKKTIAQFVVKNFVGFWLLMLAMDGRPFMWDIL